MMKGGCALLAALPWLGLGSPAWPEEPPLANGGIDFDQLTVATEPAYATSAAPVRLRVTAPEEQPSGVPFPCPVYGWNPPIVEGHTIVFNLTSFGCPPARAGARAGVATPVTRFWDVGHLAAGVYVVKVIAPYDQPGVALAADRIEVRALSPVLRLRHDEFTGSVSRGGAPPTLANGVPVSDESGYFTFYDETNVEVTLKILDGRAINGHYWVFAASMTDRPFTLTVLQDLDHCLMLPTDPKSVCPWRDYVAQSGQNRNFIDVAFPLAPPGPGGD
jgi:hypothetical protein